MSEALVLDLAVKGMDCQGCANAVKRTVARLDPEAQVSVDLAAGRVQARTTAAAEEVMTALTRAGYAATRA